MTKASDMSYTIPDEKVKKNHYISFTKILDVRSSFHKICSCFCPALTQHAFCSFQVVITYVAYLCARLLDLREETKAARCIQMAWRRHRLRKQLERKKVSQIEKLWLRKKASTATSANNFLNAKSMFKINFVKLIESELDRSLNPSL